MNIMTNKQIEEIECKYLNKFYHFLKFAEDEMMIGLENMMRKFQILQ